MTQKKTAYDLLVGSTLEHSFTVWDPFYQKYRIEECRKEQGLFIMTKTKPAESQA